MKVLILTTVMAPYRVNLFNELGKYCDLTVCFEQEDDTSRNDEWYEHNINGFHFISLRAWEKSLNKIKFSISNYVEKDKYNIALAYEYSTKTAMLFMLLCRAHGIPYFINCDGAFINNNLIKNSVKKFFIKRAKCCLAGGEYAKKYFLNFKANEKNIYIHNFTSIFQTDILSKLVTREQKDDIKKELNILEDKVILSVGQFVYRKGYDVLLKACKNLDKSIGVYFVGGEPTKEYLDLKESLGLENVHFIGFKTKDELANYYKSADVFVLPTREDIWGLVINEAMAYGLPVVTTDKCVAGLELIKDYENGFIVKVENSEELADRINMILSDYNMREIMGKNNLEKIRPYTIENMAKKHMDVIRNIVGENK